MLEITNQGENNANSNWISIGILGKKPKTLGRTLAANSHDYESSGLECESQEVQGSPTPKSTPAMGADGSPIRIW